MFATIASASPSGARNAFRSTPFEASAQNTGQMAFTTRRASRATATDVNKDAYDERVSR
jgi:hypothetical protein